MAPKGSPAEVVSPWFRISKTDAMKGEIVGMLATGMPQAEIQRELNLSKNTLWRFIQSHRAEIQAAVDRRARRLEDYTIASQIDRIAELQWWYDKTKAEAEEFGITVVETITSGKADKEVITATREYRAAMVKEARGILRDAAEELGQLKDKPKGGDTNIAVLIRTVEGYAGLIE